MVLECKTTVMGLALAGLGLMTQAHSERVEGVSVYSSKPDGRIFWPGHLPLQQPSKGVSNKADIWQHA